MCNKSRRNIMLHQITSKKSALVTSSTSKVSNENQARRHNLGIGGTDLLKCDHCGWTKHMWQTCWKLLGHPPRGHGVKIGSGPRREFRRSHAYSPRRLKISLKGIVQKQVAYLKTTFKLSASWCWNLTLFNSTSPSTPTATSNFALLGLSSFAFNSIKTSSRPWIIISELVSQNFSNPMFLAKFKSV